MNKLVSPKHYQTENGTQALGENGKSEKSKKQKKRVGVNPVLGNAGVMWEPSKKQPQIVSFITCHDDVINMTHNKCYVILDDSHVSLERGRAKSIHSKAKKSHWRCYIPEKVKNWAP